MKMVVRLSMILLILLGYANCQQSPFPFTFNCDTADPYYVSLEYSPIYKSVQSFCSYSGLIGDQFFWYFENPYQQEGQLPNNPVILVWINDLAQSIISPLMLEVGPILLNGSQLNNRDNSFLNYMGVLFLESPSVGLSSGTPSGNFQSLALQYWTTLQKIIQQRNLNGKNVRFALYGRQYGAIIALIMKQQFATAGPYSLILDNPILDMITQKTSVGPGGLGIGLYSPEQENIVQTKIANCLASGLSGQSNQGDQCASIGNYFEYETQLDSHDTRQQLVGSAAQPSFREQQQILQTFIQKNAQLTASLINTPQNIENLKSFTIFNQKTWNYYQNQIQSSKQSILQLARTLYVSDGFSIIASEFSMQEPVIGTTKLVAEILAISKNYRQFPEKNVYRAGSLARQVNGLTAGFFYQYQKLNYVTLSRGLYLNNAPELNATTELVLNLALNNSKLCYQGTCSNTFGRCAAMNNCSKNGVCNNQGYCNCNPGYALEDCSQRIITLNITNTSQIFNLLPRQWYLFQLTITQLNQQYLLVDTYTPNGQTELYISYNNISIDTFENFAGNVYTQSYAPQSGTRYISFTQTGLTYLAIRNPNFYNNVTFSLELPTSFIIPTINYDTDPLTIPSYVMFGVGGALVLFSIYLYFAKIK